MGEIIGIGSKTKEEYFSLIKDRNYTQMIMVGVHRDEDGNSYEVVPSSEISVEEGLGILHIAGDLLKYGGEDE